MPQSPYKPRHEPRLDTLQALKSLSLREADYNLRTIYKVPFLLTFLSLHDIPIDSCIRLLLKCLNIVSVRVEGAIAPLDDLDNALRASWFGHEITFVSMKDFYWEHCRSDWEEEYFGCIYTPALRSLCLTEELGPAEDFISLAGKARYFDHAVSNLETLQLSNLRLSLDEYHESYSKIFTPSSSTKNLILNLCFVNAWEYIIDSLTPGENRTTGEAMNVPNLEFIKLKFFSSSDKDTGECELRVGCHRATTSDSSSPESLLIGRRGCRSD
ncbi:hypothetical protein NP233_g11693 [Leucocoprinus birnbaumii]|uniref:Uncharacterized protein n=1 Tax=Leucocoprinus birnbaumii TaxID=56174 RepID=A0AAD5VGA9_9AGAR|nr:hypothetical protein NP233_g11693 [Leucocoprinus birnbaumii]